MAENYIVGMGCHVPERVVTNDDLVARLDTTREWIESHTGIVERRRADDHVDTSDMGALSTLAALDSAGWAADGVELLVCATSTPDRLVPSTACFIANSLHIDPVAFDVNAACSGFVYGVAVADAMATAYGYRRTVLCTAEKYSKVTDPDDRGTAIFFGDSAATMLLSPDRPAVGFEIVDLLVENLNEGASYVQTPVGGFFQQEGRMVKKYALAGFEKSARDLLRRNGLEIEDLRVFIGHQANLRVLEEVGRALHLSTEQHAYNVDRYGNQGGAGVATALCGRVEDRDDVLVDGDLLLLTTFGAGFTMGSLLLRRIDTGG